MRAFRLIALLAIASGAVALGLGASTGGAGPTPGPVAHAWAIKVIVPGRRR